MAKDVPTDLTLADLVMRLPLGQLVGVIGGISVMLGTTFAFGVWVSGKNDIAAQLQQMQGHMENLQARIDSLTFKDDFFRYFFDILNGQR